MATLNLELAQTESRPLEQAEEPKPSFLQTLHDRTILFRAGDWIYTTYGVFVGLAFFGGVSVALWHDAAAGLSVPKQAMFYLLLLVPLVLVGARGFSILLEWRELFRNPLQTIVKPGYMLHGGVLGGAVAILLYAYFTGNSTLLLLDAAALAMPLGEAVARLGCLVYGCCWGKPTTSRFGIRYTSKHAKVNRCAAHLHGQKIHPTQLYGSLLHLALFAAFVVMMPYKAFDGMIAGVYLIAHPILRVILEQFRSDDRGKLWGPFTHTNLYSAVQAALGAALLVWLARGGTLTAIDAGAHLGDVWAHGLALAAIAAISVAVALVFGMHRGQVGAWLPAHNHSDHAHDTLDNVIALPVKVHLMDTPEQSA